MPQEHFVLRCFSCETFQAHIVKKTKKWECKMCGAKQSVKRNYGKGSGKDCRIQVMKLNELRLKNECAFNETEAGTSDDDLALPELKVKSDLNKSFPSKWEKYLEEPIADSESELDNSANDFFVEVEEKREKKKRVIKAPDNYSNKCKKVCLESNVNEASPAVTSYWLSPSRSQKNFEGQNAKEKFLEKDRPVLSKNKLKPSKYAVYMDDVGGGDDDGGGGGDDDVKVNNSDVLINKCLNVFDSEPCDLDKILSLE